MMQVSIESLVRRFRRRSGRALVVWLIAGALWCANRQTARAVVIDFGTASQALPYTEDGLTFTNIGTDSLALLSGFLGGAPNGSIRVRASAQSPFDLVGFDMISSTPLRFESSSGATYNPPSNAHVDLSSVTGWQSITYFDLVRDTGGSGYYDNFQINYVPEPSGAAMASIGLIAVGLWRLRRGDRHSST